MKKKTKTKKKTKAKMRDTLSKKFVIIFFDDGIRLYDKKVVGTSKEMTAIINSLFVEYDELRNYYLGFAYKYLRSKKATPDDEAKFIVESSDLFNFLFLEMLNNRRVGNHSDDLFSNLIECMFNSEQQITKMFDRLYPCYNKSSVSKYEKMKSEIIQTERHKYAREYFNKTQFELLKL